MSAGNLTSAGDSAPQFPASLPSEIPLGAENSDHYLPLPDISQADGSAWEGSRFTVLAVGNPIMGDDGIGLEILAGLQALVPQRPAWQAAIAREELSLLEGGTNGMELVPVVQEAERLLILDSVAPGKERQPGQALHMRWDCLMC